MNAPSFRETQIIPLIKKQIGQGDWQLSKRLVSACAKVSHETNFMRPIDFHLTSSGTPSGFIFGSL